MLGGGAERELDHLASPEVPVNRIVEIDADTPVKMLRGVHHTITTEGGPELCDVDFVVRGKLLGQSPCGLDRREPDRLRVDVRIRAALCDRLERADLRPEL